MCGESHLHSPPALSKRKGAGKGMEETCTGDKKYKISNTKDIVEDNSGSILATRETSGKAVQGNQL